MPFSTDLAVAAYERALEPKSLVITSGAHFGTYTEPGLLEAVILRAEDSSLSVEDQGRGMAEEELARVFEPCYRGGNRETPGVGLGLPSVLDLVERMGGEVSMDSKEGVGTVVRIELPGAAEGRSP